jgi:hypothetical protein
MPKKSREKRKLAKARTASAPAPGAPVASVAAAARATPAKPSNPAPSLAQASAATLPRRGEAAPAPRRPAPRKPSGRPLAAASATDTATDTPSLRPANRMGLVLVGVVAAAMFVAYLATRPDKATTRTVPLTPSSADDTPITALPPPRSPTPNSQVEIKPTRVPASAVPLSVRQQYEGGGTQITPTRVPASAVPLSVRQQYEGGGTQITPVPVPASAVPPAVRGAPGP